MSDWIPQRELNHLSSGLGKLIEQYRNQPFIVGLLTSYLNRIQELEDLTWLVILGRSIDSGEGVQLDVIGKIVGAGRNGLNDVNYKSVLRIQIRINRSQGLAEDILAILTLSIPGVAFTYSEDVCLIIVSIDAAAVLPGAGGFPFAFTLFANLVSTKPAGVRLLFEYMTVDSSTWFRWSDGASVSGSSIGFSDAQSVSAGGILMDLLQS